MRMNSILLPVVLIMLLAGCTDTVTPLAPATPAEVDRPFAFHDAPMIHGNAELLEALESLRTLQADRTIHVFPSRSNASDENDGAASAPVVTLARAVALTQDSLNAGTATRILIGPGQYAGQIAFSASTLNETGRRTPLIIEGAGVGQTTLSRLVAEYRDISYAADTWRPVNDRANIYAHDWPHSQAPYAGPWANDYGQPFQNLATRGELIAINGRVLMPVNLERIVWADSDGKKGKPGTLAFRGIEQGGLDKLDTPYTFMVASDPNAPDHLRNRIFIRLPEGMDIAETDIRIAPPGAAITITNKVNVVVKDLSVQHSAGNMLTAGLDINSCQNVVLENIDASWNNGCGVGISRVTNAMVLDVTASNNGYKGLRGNYLNHVMFDRLTAAHNNWRGLRGGWTGWDAAGFKMGGNSHDILLRNAVFVGNHTGGLWLDVFCTDVMIESWFC